MIATCDALAGFLHRASLQWLDSFNSAAWSASSHSPLQAEQFDVRLDGLLERIANLSDTVSNFMGDEGPRPGQIAAAQGLRAHHPIIIIPGAGHRAGQHASASVLLVVEPHNVTTSSTVRSVHDAATSCCLWAFFIPVSWFYG